MAAKRICSTLFFHAFSSSALLLVTMIATAPAPTQNARPPNDSLLDVSIEQLMGVEAALTAPLTRTAGRLARAVFEQHLTRRHLAFDTLLSADFVSHAPAVAVSLKFRF